nr:hypothetical protein [Mucilaginibacter sp. E4BP6]
MLYFTPTYLHIKTIFNVKIHKNQFFMDFLLNIDCFLVKNES